MAMAGFHESIRRHGQPWRLGKQAISSDYHGFVVPKHTSWREDFILKFEDSTHLVSLVSRMKEAANVMSSLKVHIGNKCKQTLLEFVEDNQGSLEEVSKLRSFQIEFENLLGGKCLRPRFFKDEIISKIVQKGLFVDSPEISNEIDRNRSIAQYLSKELQGPESEFLKFVSKTKMDTFEARKLALAHRFYNSEAGQLTDELLDEWNKVTANSLYSFVFNNFLKFTIEFSKELAGMARLLFHDHSAESVLESQKKLYTRAFQFFRYGGGYQFNPNEFVGQNTRLSVLFPRLGGGATHISAFLDEEAELYAREGADLPISELKDLIDQGILSYT